MAWGSFGSDWLLVVRPTRAGSGADPHLSPTEAPSLGWPAFWANAQQERAVETWVAYPTAQPGGSGSPGVSGS